MADPDHHLILLQGVAVWNRWRSQNPSIRPDLRWADLSDLHLDGVDFSGTVLAGADLSEAHLSGANLSEAFLENANLTGAHFEQAIFQDVILSGSRYDRSTVWPSAFDPAAYGAIPV